MAQAVPEITSRLITLADTLIILGLNDEAALAQNALRKLGVRSRVDTGVQSEVNLMADAWDLCRKLEGLPLSETIDEDLKLPNGLPVRGYKVAPILITLAQLIRQNVQEWATDYEIRIQPRYQKNYAQALSILHEISNTLDSAVRGRSKGLRATLTSVERNVHELKQHLNSVLTRANAKADIVYLTVAEGKAVIDNIIKQYTDALTEGITVEEHRELQRHISTTLDQTLLHADLSRDSDEEQRAFEDVGMSPDLVAFAPAVVESIRSHQQIEQTELREYRNDLLKRSFREDAQAMVVQRTKIVQLHDTIYKTYRSLGGHVTKIVDRWNQMYEEINSFNENAEVSLPQVGILLHDMDLTGSEEFAELWEKYEDLEAIREGGTDPKDELWIYATMSPEEFKDAVPRVDKIHYFDREVLNPSDQYYTSTFQGLSGKTPFSSTAQLRGFCRFATEEEESILDQFDQFIDEETNPEALSEDLSERVETQPKQKQKKRLNIGPKDKTKITNPTRILDSYFGLSADPQERASRINEKLKASEVDLKGAVSLVQQQFIASFNAFLYYTFGNEESEYQGILPTEAADEQLDELAQRSDLISQLQVYFSAVRDLESRLQERTTEYVLQRSWAHMGGTMRGVKAWRDRAVELLQRLFSNGKTFVESRYKSSTVTLDLNEIIEQFVEAYRTLKGLDAKT